MKSEIESPSKGDSAAAAPPPKQKKRKSGPEPPSLSHEERFYDLFKLAWLGLHTQFERKDGYGGVLFAGGKAELERSQDIARRAWNSAIYGCAMFENDEGAIKKFNDTVKKVEAK